jgi:hypothetical protein
MWQLKRFNIVKKPRETGLFYLFFLPEKIGIGYDATGNKYGTWFF